MKTIFFWILGFLGGIALFFCGIALVIILNGLTFEYLPNWIASILGLIISTVGVYKSVDLGFYKFPYMVLGVKTLSLLYAFSFFIISSVLFSLYNYEYFDSFNGVPRWLYLIIQILCILCVWGLGREMKAFLPNSKFKSIGVRSIK